MSLLTVMEAFSHALTYQIQRSINPYAMSSAAYSELIDYYNYNAPFSAPIVASNSGYPTFQFPAQYLSYNNHPNTNNIPAGNYMPPSPALNGGVWVNHEYPGVVFPFAFVDEVAVMSGYYIRSPGANLFPLRDGDVGHDHGGQEEEEGEICVVCQSEYEGDETVATLHCGHRYHANCIKEWLLHKNVCPICKSAALQV